MNAKRYIQVIVPLKLDWEPVYSVPEGLELSEGDRVSVIFSGKEYVSIVSRTNVTPDTALREDAIHPILDKVTDLPQSPLLRSSFGALLQVIISALLEKCTTAFTSVIRSRRGNGRPKTGAPLPQSLCSPLPRIVFTTEPLPHLKLAKPCCSRE